LKYGTGDCFALKNMLSISVLTRKSQLRKWATDFGSGSRARVRCIENKIFKKNGMERGEQG